MASKSLGTLTIDLIAKTGGFVSGLNQAERASAKWSKQVQDDAASASAALAGIGAAAVTASLGVGAAGFQLLKSTSKQITETDRWAKSLRISTQELLAWQFAAEKAGVSGDQMADIFKDIGDKIGDAVLNKSGEAVDALNSLGLSAEKLSKVSPEKQLLAIGESLGKIGTNAEKTTILESLGNDLSKLLPLFDNNNEKLKRFIDLAKDYGVAPDPSSIDDLVKVNQLFEDMEAQVAGLKMEIAAGLAKVDLGELQNSLDELHNVLTDPAVLQGISDLVSEVAQLAGWLVKAAAGAGQLATSTGNRFAALSGKIDLKNIDQVNERIAYLQKNLEGRKGFYSQDKSMFAWFTGGNDSVKALNDELNTLIETRNRLSKPAVGILPLGAATVGTGKPFSLPPGETNGKVTPDASARKLESSFKSMEMGYLRQIALIDTTGKKTVEVTEQQKLQFDLAEGKLTGINNAQKIRLQQLAQEVDRLNAVKKANEENARVAAFVANLQAQNENARANLGVDVQGAGIGNKQRERLRERLSIERDFLDQQRELQKQYQSGDISQTVYDRETQALKDAQAERIEVQEDYYKKVDALQADWVTGARDGLADWVDDSTNYAMQAADVMKTALSGISSNIVEMLNGNKASWKDWGISVLKIIEQVMVNMMIANAASSIGSLFSGAASSSASSGTAIQNYGANLQLNAKGGVYSSADLSQYSNSVVSSPTLFAFAKGAGLMGEAGPEAIMPLTRASDGSLAVRAVGNGGVTPGSGGAPQVYITIDGNGNTSTQGSAGFEQFGAEVGRFVDQRYKQNMMRDIRPGGDIWNLAKGGR
ncbi:phage tail tape measure protein [Enterobacter hormaechei]|jgi:lambda family phage tail tape measure protein|uniref:phage tail tape measure protein n=1 Tax=Enterobacter hormaechei TaxID=158836 RepID=UPI00079788C2|nr:phage tail tape measure protein [Enterobacter hormaechei]MBT1784157.1 phage tail tape measure protein [Enterobacter hormaechei subsp. xiangfangensis]ELD3463195.1 phage tail tape measure protein [Enterobacter hormaechei]KZR22852.1 tail length tape measure protein [Enterobacter hormaechei subsp. steigerwaltii]MCC9366639.1 phage tail tape measure protein [Enterobacter hormaechei subsp. oharae]MCC9407132.1 phage tail tape measure protein [Enterobacter hormaechei subsp. oharae]